MISLEEEKRKIEIKIAELNKSKEKIEKEIRNQIDLKDNILLEKAKEVQKRNISIVFLGRVDGGEFDMVSLGNEYERKVYDLDDEYISLRDVLENFELKK